MQNHAHNSVPVPPPPPGQQTILNAPGIPTTVLVAQVLFWLNAVLWVVLGGIAIYRYIGSAGDPNRLGWLISSVLMFATAAVMFGFGMAMRKQRRRSFIIALAFLAVMILLTITDDFGIYDLFVLLLELALVGVLLAARQHYRR